MPGARKVTVREHIIEVSLHICDKDPDKRSHHLVPIYKKDVGTLTCTYCGRTEADIKQTQEKEASNG